MHCQIYRKKTMKKKKGGAQSKNVTLGLPRRDGFKQGPRKSKISQNNTKKQTSQNLQVVPVPKLYKKSPMPLTKLPSSSSSIKSSSESLKLPTKKKNKGKQKVNVVGSLLSSADVDLAKQRNKGLKILSNIGMVTTGK